jgi:hypothetical protein
MKPRIITHRQAVQSLKNSAASGGQILAGAAVIAALEGLVILAYILLD